MRAIDGPLALARGARVGVFGAPGAGKSSLLDAIVRHADADAVVIALVGERGREAERRLTALDARTTLICATSDRSAAERLRAAEVAFAQAEALCARGLHVLLVVDSLARTCGAARELASAAGEPAGRGGYPPSALTVLGTAPRARRRVRDGTITLIATVLSEGPDRHDPVSEAARAALDGHLVLAERLAARGWFPAIDLPASASRTIADALEHRRICRRAPGASGRRRVGCRARCALARAGLRPPATRFWRDASPLKGAGAVSSPGRGGVSAGAHAQGASEARRYPR